MSELEFNSIRQSWTARFSSAVNKISGEIMQKRSSNSTFIGALKASAIVIALSVVVGAGATHALVATDGITSAKPASLNGPAFRFVDNRRLPTVDENGAPIKPLYSAVMSTTLASAR